MTGTALYKVPAGSQLVLDGRHWLVTGRDEDGYSVEGVEDGECLTLLYSRVDQAIRDRDCDVIKPADAEKRAALLKFTGGYELMEQLPDAARPFVRGRLAVVLAMDQLESEGCKLTHANTSKGGCFRSPMVKRAKEFAPDINFLEEDEGPAGKMKTGFDCPQGRTLAKYQSLYHQYGRNPVVLMDRDHLKGRRENRLSNLQEQFIDYVIGLWHDTRKPKLAPLVAGTMTQFHVPPEQVAAGFRFPSITTIRARIKALSEVVRTLGRKGVRQATNLKGAGSTDVRALMYGEKAEMDQAYLSIFTDGNGVVRAREIDPDEVPKDLEDNEIRRLWLHAMFDVATRNPLAWITSETADADHSHALLRMATRDKTREKLRYDCKRDPAPPVGLMLTSADNGTATRNATVYASQLGMDTTVMTGRAYHANGKPFIERPFGTIQWKVLNFLPGYTGSRPGELEGYNPKPSAELSHDAIHGVITRFLVDEYPYSEHRGTGMYKATPASKLEEVLKLYGEIEAPSQRERCLHLGVKVEASTTSEGVLAFNLPFNSTELQRFAAGASKRVTIHLDPDDIRKVFITTAGSTQVMTANLTMTTLQDLTLEEAIDVMEDATRSNPKRRELHAEHLREAIERRARESGFYPDSRDPANYQTIAQLKRRADRLAQVSTRPAGATGPTVAPGSVMDRKSTVGVYQVRKTDEPSSTPDRPKPAGSKNMTFKPIKDSKL